MTIRTRLTILLLCLAAAFGLTAAGLRLTHRSETGKILASLRQERSDLLDRLLALTGQSLNSFARDYSLWDEMVAFVRSGDPGWAAINIDPSLATFNAHGAWVAGPDGSLLYSVAQDAGIAPPPLHDPAFRALMMKERDLHFFQESPAGPLEMRVAPVLPSDDLARVQEPRGWFIVARRWDETQLFRLAGALQSQVRLAQPGEAAAPASPTLIHLERPLTGWNGRTVRTLVTEYASSPLAELLSSNKEETYLFYAFGLVTILAVMVILSLWVLRPLNQLKRSLEAGEATPIRELQRQNDEFGDLARQAAQSFLQRDALRDSEDRLRQWRALHERLGRDLHDGIIQSIYAAGLGLESANNLIRTDPAAAQQRLVSCQRMFNDTLWQVRSFIHALEPDGSHRQSPAQSLTALVSTMQSLQAVPISANIDPTLAARIHPRQELHLLHMARELLSNAMRHSGARLVTISLRAQPDGLVSLEVSDDGAGFDPAAGPASGHGLANLAARAREIDARLEIDAAPGKGARIAVWFRPIN